jgi:hypothetical protein
MNTSSTAMSSVTTTSWMAESMNTVASNGRNHSTPGGKLDCRSFMRALTASATSSALAPGVSNTPNPATGWLLSRTSNE